MLSWSRTIINKMSTALEKMEKYFNRLLLFIDYIPLLGSLYNATNALNLLYTLWCRATIGTRTSYTNNNANIAENDSENDADESVLKQKSRLIREKGLTAIVTALIDIINICLAVAVIAFICDRLVLIQTFAIVRQLLISVVLANVLAMTIGAKIITKQLVLHLTQQLEDVNHVSTSMVKSVTITASAIERIVETTESTTGRFFQKCQQSWYLLAGLVISVVTFPKRSTISTLNFCHVCSRKILNAVKRNLIIAKLLNIATFGVSDKLLKCN